MRSRGLQSTLVLVGVASLIIGWTAFALGAGSESGWALKGTWSDTCSCKVTCPCFFGSGPTEGFCEGSSLFEIEKGHYAGVELDGLTTMVSYRGGKWARFYVEETATPEQAEAIAALVPLAVPFLGRGPTESVEIVSLSVERTESMAKFASPESSVEIEMVVGANGEPVKLENLPLEGLPFPQASDHTQYRSVHSRHESEEHQFEWSGRSGFVSKLDLTGEVPSSDS